MPGFLRVKNFDRFQHYKDRSPPWIKLYYDLLTDYRFACLQDASKLHLILIWLLASRTDNRIPDDPQWVARSIHATEAVDLACLVSSGFLERCESIGVKPTDASMTLAERNQNAMPETEAEAETEVETERGVSTHPRPTSLKSDAVVTKPNGHHGPNGNPAGARAHAPKAASGSPQGDAVPPGFAAFWREWPPHPRKKGRSKCLRLWSRMGLEPMAERVLAALRRWKASTEWARDGGRFIPGPEPWLNDESWEVPAEAFGRPAEDPWNPEPEGMDPGRAAELLRETMGRDDD